MKGRDGARPPLVAPAMPADTAAAHPRVEVGMITIDIRHKVEDFAHWKRTFEAARAVREAAGELGCRIYTVHGSPNDVVVSLDWDSLDRARAFLSSTQLSEGMARAGVREMPHMLVLELHADGGA